MTEGCSAAGTACRWTVTEGCSAAGTSGCRAVMEGCSAAGTACRWTVTEWISAADAAGSRAVTEGCSAAGTVGSRVAAAAGGRWCYAAPDGALPRRAGDGPAPGRT